MFIFDDAGDLTVFSFGAFSFLDGSLLMRIDSLGFGGVVFSGTDFFLGYGRLSFFGSSNTSRVWGLSPATARFAGNFLTLFQYLFSLLLLLVLMPMY